MLQLGKIYKHKNNTDVAFQLQTFTFNKENIEGLLCKGYWWNIALSNPIPIEKDEIFINYVDIGDWVEYNLNKKIIKINLE